MWGKSPTGFEDGEGTMARMWEIPRCWEQPQRTAARKEGLNPSTVRIWILPATMWAQMRTPSSDETLICLHLDFSLWDPEQGTQSHCAQTFDLQNYELKMNVVLGLWVWDNLLLSCRKWMCLPWGTWLDCGRARIWIQAWLTLKLLLWISLTLGSYANSKFHIRQEIDLDILNY